MNGSDVEGWSNGHVGRLQLTRTVVGFVNLLVAVLILGKVMGWLD